MAAGILRPVSKTSPFPGMDPYLERHWGDVHVGLIACIRAALQPNLPAGLQALGQEDVRLEAADDQTDQQFGPDVAVIERAIGGGVGRPGPSGVATVAPALVRVLPVRRTRRWVEIIDTRSRHRVVTAIEVLSPSNKAAGRDNRDYRRKVSDYISGRVNVVEIDLLRSSRDRLAVPFTEPQPSPRRPPTTYFTCVNRAARHHYWEVYATPLRDPLPTVAVPCRRTDDDVPLPLQAVIDRVYLEGGHHYLNYSAPLRPRLPPADTAWAAGRIAAAGR